jgi:hypothetical protein
MKLVWVLLFLLSCSNRGCSGPSPFMPPEPEIDEQPFDKKEGAID